MTRSLTCLALLAGLLTMAGPGESAAAVVYCRAVGVPVGCVVRPAVVPRPVVVATPAVAPRRIVRRGANLGGPVNRIGVR
jgi:hypothetical protein